MNKLILLATLSLVAACQQSNDATSPNDEIVDVASEAVETVVEMDSSTALAAVLDAQSDETKARYSSRHPGETIEFFGIEPGMSVLEGLPGGGWYSKILLPYLGSEGRLVGGNYELEMFKLFPFANEEFMARQTAWGEQFIVDAQEWGGDSGASAASFYFGSMPQDFANSIDVAFFPRVMHNPAGFQNAGAGEYLTRLLSDIHTALKPGGVLGIVQHEARPEMSDEFANGRNGYLKKAWLIEQIEAAGFEFVAESDINENPQDQPGEGDIVWRLPPTFATSREDDELKKEFESIGESNRMTLKFQKSGN